LSTTVLPLTTTKLYGPVIRGWFGTRFCVDPDCRFVGTNYHVAVEAKPKRIGGEKVVARYLATGPDDEGAIPNFFAEGGKSLKYTPVHDLAIFELGHPLHNRRGTAYSLGDLTVGQKVDIYSFPKESMNPICGLIKFQGAFEGQTYAGLLVIDYKPSDGKRLRPGASGGIVVDTTGKIVGILSSIASDEIASHQRSRDIIGVRQKFALPSESVPCSNSGGLPNSSTVQEGRLYSVRPQAKYVKLHGAFNHVLRFRNVMRGILWTLPVVSS
jgi:hypothetical protein